VGPILQSCLHSEGKRYLSVFYESIQLISINVGTWDLC
jgi:hypothetical protein